MNAGETWGESLVDARGLRVGARSRRIQGREPAPGSVVAGIRRTHQVLPPPDVVVGFFHR